MSHITHMHNPVIIDTMQQFQQAADNITRSAGNLADLGKVDDPGMGDWDHIYTDLTNAETGMFDAVRSMMSIAHDGDAAPLDALRGVMNVQQANAGLMQMFETGVPTNEWAGRVAPQLTAAQTSAQDAVLWLRDKIQPTPRMT